MKMKHFFHHSVLNMSYNEFRLLRLEDVKYTSSTLVIWQLMVTCKI